MVVSTGPGTINRTNAAGAFSRDRSTRVLLVGAGSSAVRAVDAARQDSERVIAGALDLDGRSDLAARCPGVPLLGRMPDLADVILNYRINEVQVTLPIETSLAWAPDLRAAAQEFGIPVTFQLEGREAHGVRRSQAKQAWTFCLNRHAASDRPWRNLKRMVDVALAVLALVCLLPLFAAVALAIKCTSRGPVFFRQARVGLGRRVFQMYKFRTMVVNAEALRQHVESMNDAQGISFKIINDPRLTKIGSFLRRASIDELPQLFNVLLGDMSMVGPRPIPVWVAEQLEDTRWFRRFSVLPGMSGLWQVEGRQQDFDLMASKDVKYVDEWSMGLDFRILFSTIPAVLKGVNAH